MQKFGESTIIKPNNNGGLTVQTPLIWFNKKGMKKYIRKDNQLAEILELNSTLINGGLYFSLSHTDLTQKDSRGKHVNKFIAMGFPDVDQPDFISEFRKMVSNVSKNGTGSTREFEGSVTRNGDTTTTQMQISAYVDYGDKKTSGLKFHIKNNKGVDLNFTTNFDTYKEKDPVVKRNKFVTAVAAILRGFESEILENGELYSEHLRGMKKVEDDKQGNYKGGNTGGQPSGGSNDAPVEEDFGSNDAPF